MPLPPRHVFLSLFVLVSEWSGFDWQRPPWPVPASGSSALEKRCPRCISHPGGRFGKRCSVRNDWGRSLRLQRNTSFQRFDGASYPRSVVDMDPHNIYIYIYIIYIYIYISRAHIIIYMFIYLGASAIYSEITAKHIEHQGNPAYPRSWRSPNFTDQNVCPYFTHESTHLHMAPTGVHGVSKWPNHRMAPGNTRRQVHHHLHADACICVTASRIEHALKEDLPTVHSITP